jgi:hypothetical protein
LSLRGSKVRTCTSHDDTTYILIDDVRRGDARAFRIPVAEVVQTFAQSPVSGATIGQWMAVHVQVGNRMIPTPALYTTSGHVYHNET